MAAALNSSPASGSQFRATKIWKTLIEHLRDHANVKRRRNVKKAYDECFTGSNAVDVLFRFVRLHPEQFSTTGSISRENVVRLCQAFLDNNVFRPAGGSSESEKLIKFEDSTIALYQFTQEINSSVKPLINRQALGEIDNDLRNGMDQISISAENSKTTPRGKNILIPTRKQGTSRSRFPSFGGISAQSFKETFTVPTHSSGSDEENIPDQRAGRQLKRASSFVGMVVKRSSSDSNLPQDMSSASSSSDTDPDGKKKPDELSRGGKLRLSQRLSFRKKSLSSGREYPDSTPSSVSPCKRKKEQRQPRRSMTPRKPPKHDPRRQSLAPPEKPRRSLRRLLSTPSIVSKKSSQRADNDVIKHCDRIPPLPTHHRSDANNNGTKTPKTNQHKGNPIIFTPAWRYPAEDNTKHLKKTRRKTRDQHEIASDLFHETSKSRSNRSKRSSHAGGPLTPPAGIGETPSRFRSEKYVGYLSSFSGLAQRMSTKRKSLRRSEQSASRLTGSCVIKNQSVANGNTAEAAKQNKIAGVKRKLTEQEILHLRRECVRVRLLQILDLQFVDSLITSPTYDKKNAGDKFGGQVPGIHSAQYSEVVSAYNSDDEWVAGALGVLQHLPNGYDILRKHARDTPAMKKIKLFFSISDYYKSLSHPLIDESFSEIIESVTNMLESKPVSGCLEAVQLFFHLLPEPRLHELQHLFTFLHHVVSSTDVLLTSKCSNKLLVIQTFCAPVFPRVDKSELYDRRSAGLFLFIIEERHRAFRLPTTVARTMERKQRLMETGEAESPSCIPEAAFCCMITSKEYNQQRGDFTQHHILELARAITSNQSNLPAKKKKEFMKRIQSTHPSTFERLHGPMKAIHNITPYAEPPKLPQPVILKAPSSDPLSRRRNKAKRNQTYL